MVKKNNKRRSLRNNTHNQLLKRKKLIHTNNIKTPKQFYHSTINNAWDNNKNMKQNYTALGLIYDANNMKSDLSNIPNSNNSGKNSISNISSSCIELQSELNNIKSLNDNPSLIPSYTIK